MNTIRISLSVVMVLSFIAGCTSGLNRRDGEDMYIKASALTKLSAAVESTVRYKNPPSSLTDEQLLELATRHDPILLENFEGYKLRVRREGRHAVVLVCDVFGKRALLEDVGCSGRMDQAHWMGNPEPCEFSIDLRQQCGD